MYNEKSNRALEKYTQIHTHTQNMLTLNSINIMNSQKRERERILLTKSEGARLKHLLSLQITKLHLIEFIFGFRSFP